MSELDMERVEELVAELELAAEKWTRAAVLCEQNPEDDGARRECDRLRNIYSEAREALLAYIEGKA